MVWVPVLNAKEKHVPAVSHLVPDPRASHFWDGHGALVQGYREALGLSEPAWDIYMVYPPGVRWEGNRPPVPTYWMHQLGRPGKLRVTKAPFLDPAAFERQVSLSESAEARKP